MAEVVLGLGSNLDNPLKQLKTACLFLEEISERPIRLSSIYKTEPVGPSEHDFYNAVAVIYSSNTPKQLFERLKNQERRQGRPTRYPKWTARTIDIDIITFDNLAIQADNLIIPHAEYKNRLFVLEPLKDLFPNFKDPVTGQPISELLESADKIRIEKTKLAW